MFILFALFTSALQAQQVLLQEAPENAGKSNFGPNLQNFLGLHFAIGEAVGKGDAGLDINDTRSLDILAGIKYKYKLNGMFSVGFDVNYHYYDYNIHPNKSARFPDTVFNAYFVDNVRRRFSFNTIRLNGFVRVNFDPHRGNYMGHYLDLGAGVDGILSGEFVSVDKAADKSKIKTIISQSPYLEKYSYSVFARLGVNWFAIFANYRLNNIFTSKYNLPDAPPLTVGIELNPHFH
jgi:hypothetical protein